MDNTTTQATLYIGIDIHKRSWRIHTATELFWGKGFTMPPRPEGLKQYVDKNYPNHAVHIAYEAGCCGYKPHREFSSYGWTSLVVNPADISRTGNMQYQKTDKIDAHLICRELRDNRLTSIHVPDVEREQYRCFFRRRLDLVKDFRQTKVRLKAQLLYLGIEIPQQYDNPNWNKNFRAWIASQVLAFPTAKASLDILLNQFEYLDKHIRDVSTALRRYAKVHYKEHYMLLRSIPGIGPLVACGILAELGDISRFNQKELVGYVGLMPGMRQSGDSGIRSRGISPRGNRYMRAYFVEAAWIALRRDPVMQAYWRTHPNKDPKGILIKVARKLLCRTLAVIKTGVPYQEGVVA
jgi:transposase